MTIRIVDEASPNGREVELSLTKGGTVHKAVSLRVKRGGSVRMECFKFWEDDEGEHHVDVYADRLIKLGLTTHTR